MGYYKNYTIIHDCFILLTGSLTRAYSNGLDLTDDRLRNCLLPRDVVDKYREAMMHYSKVHLHRKTHCSTYKMCNMAVLYCVLDFVYYFFLCCQLKLCS